MNVRSVSKKLLALALCLTVWMSCIVWSGVSAAAASSYALDFDTNASAVDTYYANTYTSGGKTVYSNATKDVLTATGTLAQMVRGVGASVVNSGDTAHDRVMELSFYDPSQTDSTLTGKANASAAFRISNNGTGVSIASGFTYVVQFDYKVVSMPVETKLLCGVGSVMWGNEEIKLSTFSNVKHRSETLTLTSADVSNEWKTASLLWNIPNNGSGIHMGLESTASVAERAGARVQIDNIRVSEAATVTFNYGYDSKTEKVSGATGTAVPFPADPTRSAMLFKGWNTKADGTGDYVTAATYSGQVTYYAIWEADPNATAIQLNTNGGTAIDDLVGDKGAAATLPTPVKGVYTFEGWYTDEALTQKAENVTFPETGSITLYAKWSDPAPLAADPAPVGKLLLRQTFENATLSDFITNTNDKGKMDGVVTEESYQGDKSLKATIKDTWNAQRGRPRIVLQDDDGTKVKVEAGKTYALSFWVKTTIKDERFAFYAATMGASDAQTQISVQSGNCHKLQNITATVGNRTATVVRGNEVDETLLDADQWTQVVITIPSLELDATGEDNYLALGFTSNGSQSAFVATWEDTPYYIDNIELYECRTVTVSFDTAGGDPLDPITSDTGTVNLPEPYKFGYTYTGWYEDAELTKPVTSPYSPEADTQTLYTSWEKSVPTEVTLTQDFEDTTSIDEFKTNTTKPFTLTTEKNHTDGGSKALKTTIKNHYNGNFARPIWAFQMEGQTAPMQVIPGTAATVTFSVMASRDTGTVGYMLDTINDLANVTKNSPTSGAADEFRTMQELSSTSAGTLNSAKNEVQNISLTAGQWTTITAEIPSIAAHGGGAQYLVLAITDTDSVPGNTSWVELDLYVDDIEITTYEGGHSTKVTYNTMGGAPLEEGYGIVWMDIAVEPTREGYDFDGWYTDETCQTPITTYPCEEEVTLYAGWRPAGAEVMTFEVDENYTPTVYADMDLNDAAVRNYYTSNPNNWYIGAAAPHSFEEEGGKTVLKVSYTADASTNSRIFGLRLVGKDSVDDGFKTKKGTVYSVAFKYKVEAMPVETEIRLIEGSVPWGTAIPNSGCVDHSGFNVTAADVGAGWQTGTVNFVSTGDGKGLHLVMESADFTKREGIVVYFSDIKVQSYQLSEFTTSDGAARVTGEQNNTAHGKSSLKIDTATAGRVVYASGLGERLFPTNTINNAVVWLYADADADVTLTAYNDPSLAAVNSSAHITGEKAVSLVGGKWTRVEMEFGHSQVAQESSAYVAFGVTSETGVTVYMDDVSVGTYPNDSTKVQGYEQFVPARTGTNTSRLDGSIHGYYGNTVVAGKGYNSDQSLQIQMQSEEQNDVSRTVLMLDKMDATATVGNGYIITFYAMAEEDMDVIFALGTSGTIDVTERELYATAAEAGASRTVSLQAGEWTPVSVNVAELLGKNPEMELTPYVTLAAWFAGAAADNVKNVYVDDVSLREYTAPEAAREDTLCFENTDVFGFGKSLFSTANGTMTVSLEQNHSSKGYYSLKVQTGTIAGGTRPQFNLMNANGEAVKVEKGKGYRVSYWVYLPADALSDGLRWWLTVTDSTDPYTTTDQKNAEVVYELQDGTTVTKGGWTQVTCTLNELAQGGYLRLGICGKAIADTVFYLDDIRVTEYKEFTLTGTETVWDFETYNLEDKDFIRRGPGYVTDEQNHTDKGVNALCLEGVGSSGYDRNQFILVNPATKQPYEFVKGDSYTLHFWVYWTDEAMDAFELNTWIWGTDDPNEEFTTRAEKNDKNGTYEWDAAVFPTTNEGNMVPGEWNKFEVSFTATNGKYMLVGMTNSKVNGAGYTYFLDDIEIGKPTPSTVTFDANGGVFDDADKEAFNDKGQFVERTAIGLFVTGPSIDPYREGKRFMGWSTDPEGQNHFNILTTAVNLPEMTLYAMWGDWTAERYDQIDKGNLTDKDEIKYRTEIHSEKVWTGNAKIPTLETGDPIATQDADPVTYIPNQNVDPDPVNGGLPVWLIIIIVAAVVVVGGGAVLALLLLKNKKSNEKEVA